MAPRKSAAVDSLSAKFVAIKSLKPYAKNARTHSPEQIRQIAAAIEEFGWTNPVLADGDGIVAGHGRILGAKAVYAAGKRIRLPSGALVPVDTVPVIDCTGWTDKQRRAYILADNKLALNAGWDDNLLRLELADLSALGADLDLTGFGPDEIKALMNGGNAGLTDPEEAPAPPTHPVVRLGDYWHLGAHRLLVGDSTKAEDVERLLAGAKPHLMVTDPPYGVDYDANWRNEADRANGKPYGASAIGKVQNDSEADWTCAWQLFPGDVVYCWHADRHASTVQRSLEAAGFAMRSQIIWAKDRLIISRGDYHWMHEPCWYAVRKGAKGRWAGDRKQTTLWQISHQKSETGHSTQKPIECMRRPLINNSKPGDAVYDPFLGSGTTLIAAEMEGRILYGMEIAPEYGQVIIERWQAFTGKDALLDGKTPFSAIKARAKKAK